MKRCVTIFLIFMVVIVLFAEKTGSGIEKKAYNWESGSTEFVTDSGRDNRSVPNLIDYQGKITDSGCNPITSSVSIIFTIYDDATGGTTEWTETHASITPVDGLVHVLLGSVDVFGTSLFDGSDLWLGINVNNDGEMTPRLRIVSVPYAIYANDSDKLDGYDSNDFVNTQGGTMTGNLVVNSDSGFSVYGTVNSEESDFICGVMGEVSGGESGSGTRCGIYGYASGWGINYGIYGEASGSDTNYGIYGSSVGGITNYAGYFDGNVHVSDDFEVSGILYDSDHDAGTSGQVLSSTGTATNWIAPTSGDGHSLDAADGDPTDVVYVDNDGNVGIGNSNPACDLHIGDGTGTDSKMIQIDANGIKGRLLSYAPDDIFAIQAGTEWVAGSSAEMRFTGTFGDPVHMTIKPDGNVGIGTTSPNEVLDVNGNAIIRGSIQTGTPNIEINAYGTGNRYSFIDFHSDDDNPDYSLRLIRYNTGPNAISKLHHLGLGPLQFVTANSAPIDFYTNSSHRMKIDDLGKVGIGTTNPVHKFDVRSSAATQVVSDDDVFISNMFGYHDNGLLVHTGYNDGIDIARFSSIGSGYVEVPRMVIKDSGFIGIGTTTPTSKLDVTGNITSPNSVISGVNTGTGYGVYGYSSQQSTEFHGYLGGLGCGVSGNCGDNWGTLGNAYYGVYGQTSGSSGSAVYGSNTSTEGYLGSWATGVFGKHWGSGNEGHLGSESYAVYGQAGGSGTCYAGYFDGDVVVTDNLDVTGNVVVTGSATINDILHLTPRSTTPSSPSSGDIFVHSATQGIYCYLNGSWKRLD